MVKGNIYVDGYEDGQQSCATIPWTWTFRTDTRDEHGRVIEDAELPLLENRRGAYIALSNVNTHPVSLICLEHRNEGMQWTIKGCWTTDDWLRKHLIAWAEIRK